MNNLAHAVVLTLLLHPCITSIPPRTTQTKNIQNFIYTKHALDQMQKRNISKQAIMHAVLTGSKERANRPAVFKYKKGGANKLVVIGKPKNDMTMVIITMYRKKGG